MLSTSISLFLRGPVGVLTTRYLRRKFFLSEIVKYSDHTDLVQALEVYMQMPTTCAPSVYPFSTRNSSLKRTPANG